MEKRRDIMKNKFWCVLPLLLFCLVFSCKIQNYDVIVLGGTIYDGSGSPGYTADIGIREGRIQKIGKLKRDQGIRVIEAGGKYVVPGFIDIHTHCDNGIRDLRRKNALNYLSQGVTLLVGGNCGGGTYNVHDYFLKLEEQGVGPNIVHLVGHGTVRQAVLEYEDRACLLYTSPSPRD